MEKTFTVAGTSRRNGTVKFRFSNNLKGRLPMLLRTGHTEINLIELPTAMTKADAIAYLEARDDSEQDITDTVAQGPALDVTEAAVEAAIAEMTANGRPRNAKGHFIKLDDLRAMAIAQLATA
jgi:hypothetical protein